MRLTLINYPAYLARAPIYMRKWFLLIIIVFLTFRVHAQNIVIHYIKFLHVGEKILPVHTLNISYEQGIIPTDSTEVINDTLRVINVVTDEPSYKTLVDYLKNTNFKFSKHPGKLEFGTFKIIRDGRYFYLPDFSSPQYFKNMVKYLEKKKADPALVTSIVVNYPWIYNP